MTERELKRFMAKVVWTPSGCWQWLGGRSPEGYGRFQPERGTTASILAHRRAYEHFVGAIPPGLDIDHLCRSCSCVNPEHLEPVTTQENSRRRVAVLVRKKICVAGHPLPPANVYRGSCRICRRKAASAWKRRRRALAHA